MCVCACVRLCVGGARGRLGRWTARRRPRAQLLTRRPSPLPQPTPPHPSDARRQMVLRQLGPSSGVRSELSAADVDKIVARTQGYSG